MSDSKKTITEAQKKAKAANTVWFATDLDREGEAISWHLAEALSQDVDSAKRVVFNAITEREIREAFEKPRSIDMDRVNAQQARRILDRIVGYQASLLWKRITSGLSAGRVQSVAVRLVVEREREIRAFVPDEHWEVEADLVLDATSVPGLAEAFTALQETGSMPMAKGPPRSGGPSGVKTTVRSPPNWSNWMVKRSSWAPPRNSPKISAIASPRFRLRSASKPPKCTPKKIPRAKARPNSVEPSAVPSEPVFNTTSPASNTRAKNSAAGSPVHHQHPANGRVKFPGLRTQALMGIAQKAVSKRAHHLREPIRPGCPRSDRDGPHPHRPNLRSGLPSRQTPALCRQERWGPRNAL